MTLKEFRPGLLLQPPEQRKIPKITLGAEPGRVVITPSDLDARSRLLRSSNQGPSSECVTYGLCGFGEFINWKEDGTTVQLDPHPAYVLAKQRDGMPSEDGTTPEAGLQAMIELGLIKNVYAESIRDVSNPADVRRALHMYDVIACAFDITEGGFEADGEGWVKPGGNNAGGHLVLGCGYAENFFSFQNSWGDEWGNRGFGRITWEQFSKEFQYAIIFDRKLVR